MQKLNAWIFFIVIAVLAFLSSAWFYISYGLFTPHSNIVYTGTALWGWRFLLVSAYLTLGAIFIHGYVAGKALWSQNFLQAIKTSSITLMGLISLYLIQMLL